MAPNAPIADGAMVLFFKGLVRPHTRAGRTVKGYVRRAASDATSAHAGQSRKGKSHRPYIEHPREVVAILRKYGDVRDPEVLAAAWLHDTIEDTNVTEEQIGREYGQRVLRLVKELTNPPYTTREEKQTEQWQRIRFMSRDAQAIKIADKISNLRDLARDAPEGWSRERRLAYIQHAGELYRVCCRQIPVGLGREFERAYKHALDAA